MYLFLAHLAFSLIVYLILYQRQLLSRNKISFLFQINSDKNLNLLLEYLNTSNYYFRFLQHLSPGSSRKKNANVPNNSPSLEFSNIVFNTLLS